LVFGEGEDVAIFGNLDGVVGVGLAVVDPHGVNGGHIRRGDRGTAQGS